MSGQACLAQDKLEEGRYAFCDRRTDSHPPAEHVDGEHRWPACSQHCMRDHVHGRYRLKLGIDTGPGSLASRAPRPDRAAKGPRDRCSVCLHPSAPDELERGKCKDQEACQARAPQLDLGLE